ncbi:MAG: hypothetical protein E7647_02165 [Ruminococcaceae bacterium]|nr:hypothetical protein [Oscillospiraceae bacterium]
MQFLVISHQLWEIAASIALGTILGLLYDFLRFGRRLLSPLGFQILLANVLDVLYLVFCGAAYCVFVFWASSGHVRWYTALGMIAGFILYRLLPGRVILPVLCFLADKLLIVFSLLLYPAKRIFVLIQGLLKKVLKFTLRYAMIKKTDKMKKKLRNEVKLTG